MVPSQIHPVVQELSTLLLPKVDQLSQEMAARIAAGIPFYAAGDVVSPAELLTSCADNFAYVLGYLAGDPDLDPDAPLRTGTQRADAGVPYTAVLHAYRIGGRMIWETLVEHAGVAERPILLSAAADIWAVTDDLSERVTEAYLSRVSQQAQRNSQLRSALLGAVLEESGPIEQRWESLAALNLPRRGGFVVAVAVCPHPGAEGLPDIETVLNRHNVTSVWRLNDQLQEGLIALRRGFDMTRVAKTLTRVAIRPVGVSAVFVDVEDCASALQEARMACATVSGPAAEVVLYEGNPLPVLLVSLPGVAVSYARTVLGEVVALPAEDRVALLETVRVWFEEDRSTSAAAERLFIHRNTVRYRLQRVQHLTGRDPASARGGAELHVALEAARIHGHRIWPGPPTSG